MIWQFSGEISRLQKVIVVAAPKSEDSDKVNAGVVGIEKGKIEFINGRNCIVSFHDPKSNEGLIARAMIRKLADREPDAMFGLYHISAARVPSGEGANNPGASPKQNWASLDAIGEKRYTINASGKLEHIPPGSQPYKGNRDLGLYQYRTGIADINLDEVVTPVKAERYAVLPGLAGLWQLRGEGKLEATQDGWRVLGPARYPAGLYGGFSTTFFLSKGVAVPEGNPGHSRVFDEATAKFVGEN